MVPRPLAGERGLLTVDATWGTIAPMQIAPGVRTVGELEVMDHIRAGGELIDTRLERFYRGGTIPGARNIPHGQHRRADRASIPPAPTILFCNGPQCAATPAAIRALIAAGYPAASILYYRGGVHDWVTLGLPIEQPAPALSPTTAGPRDPKVTRDVG